MEAARKSAVVTGASSGIGAVYADRLASRGYDLVLVARRRERLESLARELCQKYGIKVDTVAADLANDEDLIKVEAIISNAAGVSLLVNCAGLGALGSAASVDMAMMDSMLKVNVLALTRLTLSATRRFVEENEGAIINIGSIIAMMIAPAAAGYCGSKAYVFNFTRSLQAELAGSNVTVQLVMPGPVHSEFFGDKSPSLPERLFMTAETLVDTAIKAFDQGELLCFPTLHDMNAWQNFDLDRAVLAKALVQNGLPAERYRLP